MSDDRRGANRLSRRQLLALTGAAGTAGLAGCSGALQSLGQAHDGGDGPGGNPTPTYTGDTIPPVPYDDAAGSAPTVAAPAPDVTNPVLTAADVTDFGDVDYVADPFMFVEDGTWYLFFEVANRDRDPDAVIGYATSDDGLEWSYQGTILEKEAHTSYPLIWKWDGEYYMSPPTGKRIALWRATDFPEQWEKLGDVIEEDYYVHDPVFARYDDRWWLFTDRKDRDLLVFHSETLDADNWTPHASNPVVSDRLKAARQGGRPIVYDGELYLFFQDVEYEYGDKIRAYRLTELTPDAYADEELASSPVLAGTGAGWNARKMHTFDPWSLGDGNGWRCSVDGYRNEDDEWSIGIYDAPPIEPDPSSVPGGTDHVRGYYALDLDTTVAVDQSGTHNHGTIRGTTAADGDCGGLAFGDDRDRVTVAHPFPEALGGDEFTVLVRGQLAEPDTPQTLWGYTSMHVTRRLAARYDPDGPGWQFDLHGTGGQVQPVVSSGVSPDEPFTLALTYRRGDGYAIYQDGERLTQALAVSDAYHEVCVLTLGGSLTGQLPWQGDVHRLAVFDRALGEADLQRLDGQLCQ